MQETNPEVGQVFESLYASKSETYWTEQTGMVVDKEPNPLTKDVTYVGIFADGGLCWMGKASMKNVRWPE